MKMLTRQRLLEVLDYDKSTGVFTNRITRRSKAVAGSAAGSVNFYGYVQICIDKKIYMGHRLAWLYVHGVWPASQIDHKNEIKHDNRIDNLRLATKAQNMMNVRIRSDNTSGVKGVSFTKRTGKWASYIYLNGKRTHLGSFLHKADAEAAVRSARTGLHGEFCNHGNAQRAS